MTRHGGDDMDLATGIPGLPASEPPAESTRNGSGLHVERFNPYAGQKRVAVTYRLFEDLAAKPVHLSDALKAAGWGARPVSANELVQMWLHRFPDSVEEAEPLIQAWAMLQSSPPRRPGS